PVSMVYSDDDDQETWLQTKKVVDQSESRREEKENLEKMMRIVAVVTLIAIFGTKVHCQGMAAMAGMQGMMGSMLPLGMAGGDFSAREFMTLDNAVKAILGPDANPSPALIILAAQQGGMPITATGMLPYMALMQAMAREQNMTIPGVLGTPTKNQVDNYIMEKTMQWVQQRTMYGTMTENPDVIMRLQGSAGGRGGQASMVNLNGGNGGATGNSGSMPGTLASILLARQPSSASSAQSGSSNNQGSGLFDSQNPLINMMAMKAMGMLHFGGEKVEKY
ncbi:hypothetical protein MAR_015525, partial [Mya arenaria]